MFMCFFFLTQTWTKCFKELTKKILPCNQAISYSYATIETGEYPISRPHASSPLTSIIYTPPPNVSSDFQKIISIFLSTRHSSSLRSVSNLRAAPLILSSGGSQRERDEDVTVTAPHQGFFLLMPSSSNPPCLEFTFRDMISVR